MEKLKIKVWGLFFLSKKQILIFEMVFLTLFILLTVFLFSYDFHKHLNNEALAFHAKYTKYISLACTFLIIVETQYLWSQFIQAQLDLISKQKQEIELQKEKIEKQNNNLKDSIKYASRIQSALLPSNVKMNRLLKDHFLYFKPRDVVSGDFYWIDEHKDKIIVAVADCTGHGVPGAFMSMLGSAFLHEIVNKTQELKADAILNDLRAQLIRALHQTGKTGESRDGMDLTLYILDRNSNKMQYAGANNPLIIVRNGELVEYKADKMPIGIHDRFSQSFTCNHIDLQNNDMLYTYSDGYVDQFGGEDGKKFMSKRFKKMLSEIGHLDISEQYKIIESTLQTWMNGYAQVDDILVIGVRV